MTELSTSLAFNDLTFPSDSEFDAALVNVQDIPGVSHDMTLSIKTDIKPHF